MPLEKLRHWVTEVDLTSSHDVRTPEMDSWIEWRLRIK
jgi:hypothetical protein